MGEPSHIFTQRKHVGGESSRPITARRTAAASENSRTARLIYECDCTAPSTCLKDDGDSQEDFTHRTAWCSSCPF